MRDRVTIGNATLYLGDCRTLLSDLCADALISDPPYGINYSINARGWNKEGLDALKPFKMEKREPIEGDDQPFDPSLFVEFPKVALFGANHFAHALPPGGRWVVWDKRCGSKQDDHSDCELVWTNQRGANRIHRQKWRGIVREGEENVSRSHKLHPNQKPVALMMYLFDLLKLEPGQTVLDPFMGSGSTAVAAHRMEMKFIGVEINSRHFETACNRLITENQGSRP